MRLVHVLFEADASQAVLGFPVFFFDVVNIIRDDKRNIKLVGQRNQFFVDDFLVFKAVILQFNVVVVWAKKIFVF